MDGELKTKNSQSSSFFSKPKSQKKYSKKFGCRLRFPIYACSSVRKGEEEDEDECVRKEKKEIRVVSMSLTEVKREEEEEEQRSDRKLLEHTFSEQSSSKVSASSEKDQSLNLGMGLGLMLLLSNSTTELNKMVKLSKEMETLLIDIKTEIKNKKNEPMSSEKSNNTAPISFSISEEHENSSDSILPENCELNNFETKLDGGVNERDEMEAELEVELERLQFSAEIKNSLPPLRLKQVETNNEINHLADSFSDDSDENSKIYEQHEYVYEQQFEEEKQEDEDERNYNNNEWGVCPFELERRLLEVQESRQKDRIEELVIALEFAERKLHEKDREICWWRDTAKLVTQHKDDPHFR